MRIPHQALSALSLVVATAAISAAPRQSPPADSRQPPKTVTLSGCIVANPNQPGGFTLSDPEQATNYRLTGMSVRDYAGHRVEVSGTPPKRLQIVGGLYPSPNIAAQAGSDPTKAAMAAASGPTANNGKPLSEFRVRSVRTIPGPCPEK